MRKSLNLRVLTSVALIGAGWVSACSGGSDGASLVESLPSSSQPGTGTSTGTGSGTVTLPTPGGGTATSTTFDGEGCADGNAGAAPAPAILQLVVDTSTSMTESPDGGGGGGFGMGGGGGPSKWTITRDALIDAMGQLGSDTAVGLSYFPGLDGGLNMQQNGGPCITDQAAVDIDLLGGANSQQRNALTNSLNSTNPNGYTPTHGALRLGVQTVQAYSGTTGDKFVVLITDGSPTRDIDCNDIPDDADVLQVSQPIIDEAAAAAASGIRTFVIGSPGSENAREALSRIASVGGTPRAGCSDTGPEYCHFDMTTQPDFAAALQQALGNIVGQIAECEFSLPSPPSGASLDLNRVNVDLVDGDGNPTSIQKAPAGSNCASGWDYTPDLSRIMLCPSTCDTFGNTPGATLNVVFGCVTVEGPPA